MADRSSSDTKASSRATEIQNVDDDGSDAERSQSDSSKHQQGATGRFRQLSDSSDEGNSSGDEGNSSDTGSSQRFWATRSPSQLPVPGANNDVSPMQQLPDLMAAHSRMLVRQNSTGFGKALPPGMGSLLPGMSLPPEISGTMGRDVQSRMLFVSLLENYCRTYDDDPLRNRRLFFTICRTLYSMGIIGKEYVDEVASVRATYSDAFRQLVVKAQESLASYEQRDIETGIRSLTTGLGDDDDDSFAFDISLTNGDDNSDDDDDDNSDSEGNGDEWSWSNDNGGRLATRSSSSSESDSENQFDSIDLPRMAMRSSRVSDSSRPTSGRARSASAANSSVHETMWMRRSSRVSASSATTFENMVMDMHRSRYHDDFIQLRCLGKGGFGKVYEVRNKLDGRRYAVKQIRIKGEITAEKTLREIKTLANLDHPNIVRYYSSWIEVTKIRRKGSSQKSSFGNHRLAHSTSPLAAMYGMPFGAHAAMGGGLDRSATPDSQRRHQELTVSSNESESDSELASGTHMQPLRNPFGRQRGSVPPAANGRMVGLNTASEPVTAYCNQRQGFSGDKFYTGEEAVMLEVSLGHTNGKATWQQEADEIVFERSSGKDMYIAAVVDDTVRMEGINGVSCDSVLVASVLEDQSSDSSNSSDGNDDEDQSNYSLSSCSDGVVFADDAGCDYAESELDIVSFEEDESVFKMQWPESSSSGHLSSTKGHSSPAHCSRGQEDIGSATSSTPQPIPIKRRSQEYRRQHRRQGSRLSNPQGQPLLDVDSNYSMGPGVIPRSMPSQSGGLDFAQNFVVETTLFVQMQLCQTTLQEYLSQRNLRIAERHERAMSIQSMASPWISVLEHDRLIDPILNIRLFRAIVEGVKYFHDRGVIHRDLKGANVFLDMMFTDNRGNALSRSGSGFGRPDMLSRTVSTGKMPVSSPLFESHSDVWDAFDGGNLREKHSVACGTGSRKIDWDVVFDSILASQNSDSQGTPLCSPGASMHEGAGGMYERPVGASKARLAGMRHAAGAPVRRASGTGKSPLVTFIPRIGDFGLATKSTLEIRSTTDEYAFVTNSQGSQGSSRGRESRAGSCSTGTRDATHTSNVGTITYAAPEQLTTQTSEYNEKADIYSLGIIFFELYYPFATAMERMLVIKDLRRGVFPQPFVQMWPKEAAFILWLMSEDPEKRPAAKEILMSDLIDVPTLESAQLRKEVTVLKMQLAVANQRNEELSMRVRELERLVDLKLK